MRCFLAKLIRSIALLVLLGAFGFALSVDPLKLSACEITNARPVQPSTAYDGPSQLAFDYDSAPKPHTNRSDRRTVTRGGIFARFTELLAAEESAFTSTFNKVGTLDFSTPPNGAVFYSGPGQGARAAAFAERTGGMIIEMTPGGQQLMADPVFQSLSPGQQYQVWQAASTPFAQDASGGVNAFINGARATGTRLLPENTWHHHQNGTTMQEVNSDIHSRFTHRGGVSAKKKQRSQ